MPKRILFHYPILNRGGAELSSLRMMKALADRGWGVTLVLTTGGGNMENAIDPRIQVVKLRSQGHGYRFLGATNLASRIQAIPDLLAYGWSRVGEFCKSVIFLGRRYDAAGVLLMGMSSRFVQTFVRAPVKVIWIRSDLAGADNCGQVAYSLVKAARDITYFICVSEVSRQSLVAVVPQARGKAIVIHNILQPESMRAMAAGESPFRSRGMHEPAILTVCRLSDRAKGLLRMVSVCRRLVNEGFGFVWYVAGDGPDKGLLERAIAEAGLTERMVLLGNLANPYPAYRACDFVAMLSRYEGLCGVVNEARILDRPILATRVSGIDEQLTDGINGLIVDNDEEAILAGMTRMLSDPALRDRLARGGYPAALLDDDAKLDRLESLFLGRGIVP